MAVAVIGLLMEETRHSDSGLTGVFASRSARPKPRE
jgi:hypothetical protein